MAHTNAGWPATLHLAGSGRMSVGTGQRDAELDKMLKDWRQGPPLGKRVLRVVWTLVVIGLLAYAVLRWVKPRFSDAALYSSPDRARGFAATVIRGDRGASGVAVNGARVSDVCEQNGVMLGRIVSPSGEERIAVVWLTAVPAVPAGPGPQEAPAEFVEVAPKVGPLDKARFEEPAGRRLAAIAGPTGMWYCSFPSFWFEVRTGARTVAEAALTGDLARLPGAAPAPLPTALVQHYRAPWYRGPIQAWVDRKYGDGSCVIKDAARYEIGEWR